MNALHADVLATQCRRFSELIDKFRNEIEEDSKLSQEERITIHAKLTNVVCDLDELAHEIHNRYRHIGNSGYLPK